MYLQDKQYICTFPDYTRVSVSIITPPSDTTKSFLQVKWTSKLGLTSTVWGSKDWISL